MTVTIDPAATADAGLDQTICEGDDVTLAGNIGGSATSSTWSTSGDGTFDDVSLLAPVYTPGSSDITTGTVTLTLQANGNGSCAPVTDAMTLTIAPSPVVDAGTDAGVCPGDSYNLNLSAPSASNYSGLLWTTGGDGSFNDATSLTPTYTPGANDNTNGSVTLTLEATGIGTCATTVTDDMILVTDGPIAVDQNPAYCRNNGVSTALVNLTALDPSINGGTGNAVTWYSDAGLSMPVSNPTGTTVNDGDIFYAEVDNGTCTNVATVTITVQQNLPTANNLTPSVCEDVLNSSAAQVNLTTLNSAVDGGAGNTIIWWDDFSTMVPDPTDVVVNNGDIFYAEVYDGVCRYVGEVTYTVNTLPSPTISGDTIVCVGGTESYTTESGNSNYVWTVVGGAIQTGGGPNDDNITVQWNGAGPTYTIEVNYTDGNGCTATAPTQEAITILSAYVPPAANDGPVCQGGDVQLSTPEIPGATYTWSHVNGFSSNLREPVISGVTATDAGTYTVVVELGTCVSQPGTTDVIVNSGSLPTADLSGSSTTCAGSTVPLTVNLTGTAPWIFEYSDGTNSFFENINSSPYTFNVSPSVTTTYSPVSVYDANCNGTVTGSATINITPAKEVKIRLDSISGIPGANVTVPIRVIDFEDMMTMQFTVAWDPNLLTYTNVSGFGLANISASSFGTGDVNSGFLTFSWNTASLNDTTITDSTAIFSVVFDVATTVCPDALVTIDESPAALTQLEMGDANLCIANVTVVGGNVEIQSTASITSSDADNLICYGDQVVFTGLPGGMTNYEFYLNGVSVQNGANSVYVNNSLTDQDSVNVVVGDAQGCTLPAQGIITTVNQITITPIITNISTCGGSDGVIDPGASGGSGTYTYFWTGSGISDPTIAVQSGLGRGFYTVDVNDGTCTESLTIELKEPVSFTLSAIKTDVSTTGEKDGEIDLTISGGTGPFTVLWTSTNGFTSNDQDIDSLYAGTYTATVTDGSGVCTDAIVVQINQPTNAIVLNATKTDVTTCWAADGTITLIIAGGSGDYNITWSGPDSYTSNSQYIDKLQGGLYIASVEDNITGITAQWTVQINEPEGFSIEATPTDIVYCTSTDGTISLDITGGSGNFGYAWKGLNGLIYTSSDKDIINLQMGDYRVIVTDNISGCVDSLDAEVGRPAICEQPCGLYVESTTNNTSCPDTNDGVAVINIISGGSGPGNYYVSLDTGKTFVPFLGQDITAINAQGQGSYLYIVQDAVTGCTDQTVANVGVSTNLMANISASDAGCAEDDGMITFNISGGVTPFEVDIVDRLGNVTTNSGNGFFQFTDLTPGNYFYSVREQSGCTIVASDSIAVGVDCQSGCSSLIASAHSFGDATCGSDPNGKAVIDVTGGSSPYEYSVDGANWIPFISGNVIDQLPPNGTYNIAIRQDEDNSDCRTTVSVTINGPDIISLESPIITTQKASCNQNDGAVKLGKISGGTGSYSYQIDGAFIILPSDSIVTDLGAGMHTFSVIDAASCQADFGFEVESPGVIVASATDVPVSCTSIFLKAGIRIEVDLDATTLPGPYEAYVAKTSDPANGTIYQIPDNGIRTILSLDKDFYTVNISSNVAGGCTYTETVSVFSGAYPLDFEVIDSDSIVSCIGDIGSITIGNVIGDPDTTFIVQLISETNAILETYEVSKFEFEGGFTIDETNTDKLVAGQYYIKIIQNQNECVGVSAISQLITIYEPLGQLGFEILDDDVSLADRPTGYILGEVIPSGGNPYEVRIQLIEPVFEMNVTDIIEFNENRQWEQVNSTGDNLNRFPARFDSLWAGLYEINVRDAYGCEYWIEHSIQYDETVFIPNVFTPNGDGYNDTFYIRNLPQSGTQVIISNRNGFVVFKSDDYNYDTLWDGGDFADGIYYYNISTPGGETFKGWVEKWSGARP
jgi:gliding motility-associated-like protein